jgi:hypothetical protein
MELISYGAVVVADETVGVVIAKRIFNDYLSGLALCKGQATVSWHAVAAHAVKVLGLVVSVYRMAVGAVRELVGQNVGRAVALEAVVGLLPFTEPGQVSVVVIMMAVLANVRPLLVVGFIYFVARSTIICHAFVHLYGYICRLVQVEIVAISGLVVTSGLDAA